MSNGTQYGGKEIRAALAASRRLFVFCGLFSVVVNLLMLTGPLFMLQVYDRVLTSRSEATLVALIGIVAFLFLMMGVLDHARARAMTRAGARLQERLDSRVLRATLARAVSPADRARPAMGLRDLETILRFTLGRGPFVFFDAPWTPVFLFALFTFHWLLGLLAIFSGLILLLMALLNQVGTARVQNEAGVAAARSAHFVEQMRAGSETVLGLGMQEAVVSRSWRLRGEMLDRLLFVADRNGLFGMISRTLRLFLQSMMLGLGAWLAIRGEVTPGIMIAASILLGRALAPIEQVVMGWPLFQQVLAARRSLAELLAQTPPEPLRTALPPPQALVEVQNLVIAPPGAKVPPVRGAVLRLAPGQAAGIAGPSASGKSTLARALAGVWRPLAGTVRLDGAELDHYGAALGRHIGYLPQEVVLFEGTVAQNIARFSPDARDEEIVDAARRTGAHRMILGLPGGYDFQVAAGGAALSGGQRQRIAMARAFYGSPVLVVMDEPDSNLDVDGTMALARAVEGHKKRGGAVVIVAHRHGAFAQCDIVYLMENGRPVPATSGRRSAPVRQLQSGRRYRVGRQPQQEAKKPAAVDGKLAAQPQAATPAPPAETESAASGRLVSREEQMAGAIARVTGRANNRNGVDGQGPVVGAAANPDRPL